MTVNLNQETLRFNNIEYEKEGHTTVEIPVNVPDINPDILKVLEIDGFSAITEKSIHGGKITVCGKVNLTLLYAPDGEAVSKAKSITATADFTYTTDCGIIEDDLQLLAECETDGFTYTLLNSRKINLRCSVNINVKVCRPKSVDISVSADKTSDLCLLPKQIRVCSDEFYAENGIPLHQEWELPTDKPTANEILKVTVLPRSLEFTMTTGSAYSKGQLKICCLYISADDGEVCFDEHIASFEETLEIPDAQEDMEGDIDYFLSDLYWDLKEDSDGEQRIISIDTSLIAIIRGHKVYDPNIICDAYSLSKDTSITANDYSFEQLIDNTTSQFTQKFTLDIPENLPELSRVCDAKIYATAEDLTISGEDITITGTIVSKIVYLTASSEIPICSFSDKNKFNHTVSVPGINADTICDAKIFTEHISYNMTGNRNIDMRIIMGLSIKSFTEITLPVVSEISLTDITEKNTLPSVIICFTKQEDSLWSLAKEYKTTTDKIIENNDINCGSLSPGQCLKIFR